MNDDLRNALDIFYAQANQPSARPGVDLRLVKQAGPHASDALAVHPAQVKEARAKAKRRGVPTEFLPDGRPIMRSRAHQKEYLKKVEAELKIFNKDGGYGD